LTTLSAFQIPSALATPAETHYLLWFTVGANGAVALLRVWLGLVQGDAPNNPTPVPAAATSTPASVIK
jgi:hypothetical protein